MRTKLALVALAGGIVTSLLPVQPASAVCWEIAGHCYNPCSTVGGVIVRADEATGGVLPTGTLNCLA